MAAHEVPQLNAEEAEDQNVTCNLNISGALICVSTMYGATKGVTRCTRIKRDHKTNGGARAKRNTQHATLLHFEFWGMGI